MSTSQKRKISALDDGVDLHQLDCVEQYTIGWICALPIESAAAAKLLDEKHSEIPNVPGDNNSYRFGRIGGHNVVIGCLPAGRTGLVSTAIVAQQMKQSFVNLRLSLMVGIGGAVPSTENDIRLGDVVVSQPHGRYGGVVQYDLGKTRPDGEIERTGSLSSPPEAVLTALSKLQTTQEMEELRMQKHLEQLSALMPRYSFPSKLDDNLYRPDQRHKIGAECSSCGPDGLVERGIRADESPVIHYGTIASGNQVMKDGVARDRISRELGGVLCFEMEAAALMNNFPCLIVRGISDYSDSHKNDGWQRYAAAVAAAFAKELLMHLTVTQVAGTQTISEAMAGFSQRIAQNTETARRTEQKIDQKDNREILEWLSLSTHFSAVQNATYDARMSGTGKWLVEHDRYLSWISTPGLLWLNGVAGCGKTLLSSKIIDHIQRQTSQIAYWYFQFNSADTQNLTNVVRSLIRQLIRSEIPKSIRRFWAQHQENNSEPSTTELIVALSEFVRASTQPIYFIFDALDEFPETSSPGRSNLLAFIKQLVDSSLPFLHILVTSRREPDIKKVLGQVTSNIVNIDSLIEIDVDQFVVAALDDDCLAKWGDDLVALAKSNLLLSGERRFRWADLQLKRLRACPTAVDYRDALDTIPKTLEETYHQALDTIDVAHRQRVRQILIWLTTSHRELRSAEVAAVVAFPFVEDVLKICTSVLVTVIDGDTTETIKLAHFTVKEFLIICHVQDEIMHWYNFTVGLAHRCITEQAVDCLFGTSDSPETQMLIDYASEYWPEHARRNDGTADWAQVQSKVNTVLEAKSRQAFIAWLRLQHPHELSYDPDVSFPLYFACLLGLRQSVAYFWEASTLNLTRPEGRFRKPINAAAVMGHHELISWITTELTRNWPEFHIGSLIDTPLVIENLQQSPGHVLLQILRPPWDPAMERDIVRAAAANRHGHGKEIIEHLLDDINAFQNIDESLMESASHNRYNATVLEALASRRATKFPVTLETLVAVVELSLDAFTHILGARVVDIELDGHAIVSLGEARNGLAAIQMMLNRGVVVVITDTLVSSLATSPFGSEIITLLMNDPKIEQNLTSEGVATIAGEFDLRVFIRFLKDHGCPIGESVKIMERVACNSYLRRPEFSHVSSSRKLPRRYRPTLERSFMRDITAAIHEIIGEIKDDYHGVVYVEPGFFRTADLSTPTSSVNSASVFETFCEDDSFETRVTWFSSIPDLTMSRLDDGTPRDYMARLILLLD
ncbi:hypothetical protein D6C77_02723 [Aureobasidium pullulans]|nr:hypothetical protein D6C77_02723 [Aureobasidium pullulans]